MKKNNHNKGFTLIELLVVIAIIGLLSTLAVVSLNNARGKARDAKRKTDMNAIATSMELYFSENETYPTNGTGACANENGVVAVAATGSLDAICGSGNSIKDSTSTYLNSLPEDPGASGSYIYEGTASTYCISATLEDASFFVCLDGSCFARATNCSNI